MATLAALADGLPPESRSKRKYTGIQADQTQLILALIFDMVSVIAWRQTADGRKGINQPKSMYQIMTGEAQGSEEKREYQTFDSGEDFEAARNEILRRGGFIP